MRIRYRRHRIKPPELDITAFLNLMVILIPFLLITAVFSRITIIDLNLPPSTAGDSAQDNKKFELEVIVRAEAIDVSNRNGVLIKRIFKPGAEHDYKTLSVVLQNIKAEYPDKLDATILSAPDVSYDTLIQVMDKVRVVEIVQAGSVVQAELFPEISIGDAPVEGAQGG